MKNKSFYLANKAQRQIKTRKKRVSCIRITLQHLIHQIILEKKNLWHVNSIKSFYLFCVKHANLWHLLSLYKYFQFKFGFIDESSMAHEETFQFACVLRKYCLFICNTLTLQVFSKEGKYFSFYFYFVCLYT